MAMGSVESWGCCSDVGVGGDIFVVVFLVDWRGWWEVVDGRWWVVDDGYFVIWGILSEGFLQGGVWRGVE